MTKKHIQQYEKNSFVVLAMPSLIQKMDFNLPSSTFQRLSF
ncbi:hypothetical protein M084_0292 [Bacteroides fragilis str. 3988 T1]|nr:hypothetical protein M084_0292 [Bacteroides fragilis str. 3988 T1]